jgi:hypothetical protein
MEKLLSIQLNSNRPAQLAAYFDNLEETTDNPSQIEVLVNIDAGDEAMKSLLLNEIPKRKFTLKFIETPKPASFCDLWKPLNKLLTITDPQAYFLLNISDEMFFITKGWDSQLKKYVGYFPDHLFRLRASRNKIRHYFDRWECSFVQDCIPFTTKKWVDIGGDWNPCFGPDSFQQLVAFYLTKEGLFSNEHYLREIPVMDIQFSGDFPSIGMAPEKMWRRHQEHIIAMEIFQSHKMQVEARRRAILIKANIIAHKYQLKNYKIQDIASKKEIILINQATGVIVKKFSYHLSWLSITLTNQWRKLFFANYFGSWENSKSIFRTFPQYLYLRYRLFYHVRRLFNRLKSCCMLPFQK